MLETNQPTIGWREWIYFPTLGGFYIKAKTDTGARTSALHAFFVESFTHEGKPWVRFGLHPQQLSTEAEIICQAQVKDSRQVTDSGGHREERYVIEVPIVVQGKTLTTEMTLTNRDTMRFRMLLGRNTLNHHFLVNPAKSFLAGGTVDTPPDAVLID
ncbi:MAG TPA: RimK/LysX family protein [Cellvibrionaceae bacterium]